MTGAGGRDVHEEKNQSCYNSAVLIFFFLFPVVTYNQNLYLSWRQNEICLKSALEHSWEHFRLESYLYLPSFITNNCLKF